MDPNQVNFVKVENQLDFDWFYIEEHFESELELPPPPTDIIFEHYQNNYSEFDTYLFPYQNHHFPYIDFKDFEDLSVNFSSYDYKLQSFSETNKIDIQSPNTMFNCFDHCDNVGSGISEIPIEIQRDYTSSIHEEGKKQIGRSRSTMLELDEIQKHFDVPITKAAKEMKVGLTVLKKRCRELNIMRWPHRKIKSLKSLINSVKELGLTNEIGMLEEHKRMVEKIPQMELTEETKKLRQACFKANYKRRRAMAPLA